MKTEKSTTDVDKHIGKRIHELRLVMGMSRELLAEKVGVTHQQVHKYECGINRMAIGRLLDVAKSLRTPIAYFLEGIDANTTDAPTEHRRMSMEVTRNFMRISSHKHREAVNDLIRNLADED